MEGGVQIMTNEIDFQEIEKRVLEKITDIEGDELTNQIAKIATGIATLVVAEYHQELKNAKEV